MQAELELWRVIISDVKLNISPGSAFHCAEPGWFRVCFANMDDATMGTAVRRIRTFVFGANNGSRGAPAAQSKKTKKWDAALRLSLPRRFDDVSIVTPPQSPLVQAAN